MHGPVPGVSAVTWCQIIPCMALYLVLVQSHGVRLMRYPELDGSLQITSATNEKLKSEAEWYSPFLYMPNVQTSYKVVASIFTYFSKPYFTYAPCKQLEVWHRALLHSFSQAVWDYSLSASVMALPHSTNSTLKVLVHY